jgi:hypothetical protein
MAKSATDPTGNVNFTRVTMTASIAISAIAHSTLAAIRQPAENGLKARTSGTARNAIGCMTGKQSNA